MGILKGIFRKKATPYTQEQSVEAAKLVNTAYAVSVSMYLPLLEKFPELKKIKESGLLKTFDLITACASVGIVSTQINHVFNQKETQQYMAAINKALAEKNELSSSLVINIGRYINLLFEEKKISGPEDFAEAVGAWVFNELADTEGVDVIIKEFCNRADITNAIGTVLTNNFRGYWHSKT